MINKLHLGDARSILDGMPDNTVDLTVTSPPYDDIRSYNGADWNFTTFQAIASRLVRVTKPGGVIMWNVSDATIDGSETGTSFRQALHFMDECGLKLHDTMLYQNPTGAYPCGYKSTRYTDAFEYVFIFVKGKIKTANLIKDKPNVAVGTGRYGWRREGDDELLQKTGKKFKVGEMGYRTNIWRMGNNYPPDNELTRVHPARMPIRLAEGHIRTWSNEGDVVLDPFAGIGTTLRAAIALNRQWIGIEINERYYKIAKQIVDNEMEWRL